MTDTDEKKIAILALHDGNLSQYWKFIEDGVDDSARQRGLALDYYKPSVTGESKVAAWQMSIIDKILSDGGVKAAGLALQDPGAGRGIIERFTAAGIPCVTFDTDVPDSQRAFFIGANNVAAGRTCAFTLAKNIAFKGKVAIDSPSFLVQSCVERIAGFRDAMGKYRDIEIAIQAGGSDRHEDIVKAAEEICAIPDIAGIFTTTGGSAKANADILKRTGRSGKVILICVNVDANVRDGIRDGVIQMAIGQRPYSIGYRLADYLGHISGYGLDTVMRGIPSSRIVDTGIHQVTKSNLDSYLSTLDRQREAGSA
mgnify:CR=1 FL=1